MNGSGDVEERCLGLSTTISSNVDENIRQIHVLALIVMRSFSSNFSPVKGSVPLSVMYF